MKTPPTGPIGLNKSPLTGLQTPPSTPPTGPRDTSMTPSQRNKSLSPATSTPLGKAARPTGITKSKPASSRANNEALIKQLAQKSEEITRESADFQNWISNFSIPNLASYASNSDIELPDISGSSRCQTPRIYSQDINEPQCEQADFTIPSHSHKDNWVEIDVWKHMKPTRPRSESQYSRRSDSTQGRPYDRIYDISDFKVGTIYSAVEHERTNSIVAESPNYSQSKFGIVYSKYRKHIVIAVFKQHLQSVPIFTHNGNGLANKNNDEEYISIRDAHLKDDAAPAENQNGILWAVSNDEIRETGQYWYMMTDQTAVQVTAARVFKPRFEECRISGQLEPESTKKLLQLWRDIMCPPEISPSASHYTSPSTEKEQSPSQSPDTKNANTAQTPTFEIRQSPPSQSKGSPAPGTKQQSPPKLDRSSPKQADLIHKTIHKLQVILSGEKRKSPQNSGRVKNYEDEPRSVPQADYYRPSSDPKRDYSREDSRWRGEKPIDYYKDFDSVKCEYFFRDYSRGRSRDRGIDHRVYHRDYDDRGRDHSPREYSRGRSRERRDCR